jgi:hypothetical protein
MVHWSCPVVLLVQLLLLLGWRQQRLLRDLPTRPDTAWACSGLAASGLLLQLLLLLCLQAGR